MEVRSEWLRPPVFLREEARGFAHLIRTSIADVYAIDDADHRCFDRYVLVSDSRSRGFTIGTHDHLTGPGPESIGDDDDVSRWLFVEIVRVNDEEPDAFEIGRLLGGPDGAYYFARNMNVDSLCFVLSTLFLQSTRHANCWTHALHRSRFKSDSLDVHQVQRRDVIGSDVAAP
jgi:hypothetical protein